MSRSAISQVSESIQEKILAVASKLFYHRGIRNVGVDEIVASSGVAKSTLYKYFPSKDALVLQFLQRTDERWHQWFRETLKKYDATPQEKILAVFDVLQECLDMPGYRGCAFVNATIELATPEHPIQKLAQEHKQKLRQQIATLATEAGITNAEVFSYQLLLLFEGAIATTIVEGHSGSVYYARQAASSLLTIQ